MTLPNPSMVFTPFDPLPASSLNDMVENIEYLDGAKSEFLSYAEITTDFASAATSPTAVTGLNLTVTAPGGRRVEIEMYTGNFYNSGANQTRLTLWDGAVGSGTRLQFSAMSGTSPVPGLLKAYPILSAGSHNIRTGIHVSGGTGTVQADSTNFGPAYIMARLA